MKKYMFLISAVLVCFLIMSFVAANGQGNQQGNGNQIKEENKSLNRIRVQNRTNMIFVPWQKRNESECLEGCKCVGAIMSCPTENGRIITIESGRSGKVITITVNRTEVNSTLELEQERVQEQNRTRLRTKLENGRQVEIKIMPDVASEKAIERLRLRVCNESNNCTIVLKEVPIKNNKTIAYEVEAQKRLKILGLFRTRAKVKAQVNAENGEIIIVKKPWWAFLAKEET